MTMSEAGFPSSILPSANSMISLNPCALSTLLHDGALDADALTKIFTFVKTTADYYGMADSRK